jgi:hypothetical protein
VTGIPPGAPLLPLPGQAPPALQAKREPEAASAAADPAAVQAQLGQGQPLEGDVRSRMEHGFGQSFADVRVHRDDRAAQLAGDLSARAFTVGRDVAFGSGEYRPGSVAGDLLIAHELAHTVQQRGANGASAGHDERIDESVADGAAVAAVTRAHGGAGVAPPAPSTGGGLALRRCGSFEPHKTSSSDPDQTGATTTTTTTTAAAGPSLPLLVPEVPRRWLRKNRRSDVFLAAFDHRMVALPAEGFVYELDVPEGEDIAREFFGVVTASKEGLRLVNVGGEAGHLIDSGGKPKILMTRAVEALSLALGVQDVNAINTLHIHDDHIRNYEKFIEENGIRPEGLRFTSAFAASNREFGEMVQRLRTTTKPALVALGYGRGASTPFGTWEIPADVEFFHNTFTVGEVVYDEYGLAEPFRKLASGESVTALDIDAASVILRVTDRATGARVLVLGDPRGRDALALRAEMGEAAFGEIFEGVTVLNGFQHHTGVLSDARDIRGNDLILREALSRNGELTVVEQSMTEAYPGRGTPKPFLNSSLIEAARQLGVSYKVALTPDENDPTSLGTISVTNVDPAGRPGKTEVTSSGNSILSVEGDPQVRARTLRYVEMNDTIELLELNREILRHADGTEINDTIQLMTSARDALGQALGFLTRPGQNRPNGLIQAVLAGVGTGQAQSRSALTNQDEVDALRPDVLAKRVGEAPLEDAAFHEVLDYLRSEGELLRSLARNVETMRETGEVSEELINDLIDFNPELARRLLESAEMTPEAKAEIEKEIAKAQSGGRPSAGTRVGAGVMIAFQLWNDVIGPGIALWQQTSFDNDVKKFFNVIQWWQSKGVVPNMRALENNVIGDNVNNTDPELISQMIQQDHIDYLALTSIDNEERQWDPFNIWMDAHVKNLDDYVALIRDKPMDWCSALRIKSGDSFEEAHWEYRAATISPGHLWGSMDERWLSHARLDKIMNAMARRVVARTEKELEHAWTTHDDPVPAPPGMQVKLPGYEPRPMLSGPARPKRRVRFRAGTSESDRRAYSVAEFSYAVGHLKVAEGDIWDSDAQFFVFDPAEAAPLDAGEVGSDYLLVTGADFNTYSLLTMTTRERHEQDVDASGHLVVLKRNAHGNPSGLVLLKKSAVEDVP